MLCLLTNPILTSNHHNHVQSTPPNLYNPYILYHSSLKLKMKRLKMNKIRLHVMFYIQGYFLACKKKAHTYVMIHTLCWGWVWLCNNWNQVWWGSKSNWGHTENISCLYLDNFWTPVMNWSYSNEYSSQDCIFIRTI
jgi:hypothetical protein